MLAHIRLERLQGLGLIKPYTRAEDGEGDDEDVDAADAWLRK